MTEFLVEHKKAFIYATIVIVAVLLLIYLTNLWTRWLIKKLKVKLPNIEPTTIILVRRILRIMWIVLGIIALSFIFIDKSNYKLATKNFNLILYLGAVAIATAVAAASVNLYFIKSIEKKREANEDYTNERFLRYLIVVGIYFIGAIIALLAFPSMRGIAQTALGGAGVLAVIAGFASQEALSNLIGGIFIITFKPFKIGDIIEISSTMKGTVVDITLRHTIIRNYENKMIVVPNAIMNKEKLINYDLGERMCLQWIYMGISYDSDVDLAKKIMQEEAEAHPNTVDNRNALDVMNDVPKVLIRVTSLDDSAVMLRASAWAENFDLAFAMKCDLLETIKKRFEAEGISIPFPHRTLVFKDNAPKDLNETTKQTNNNLKNNNT